MTSAEDRPTTTIETGAGGLLLAADEALHIDNLSMDFPVKRRHGLRSTTVYNHAVSDVNLTVRRGEVLGLVGESGCGKTTLGRCIVRDYRPSSGHIYYRDDSGTIHDLVNQRPADLRVLQRQIRVIFQDPFSSLNPRMTIGQIVGDPLKANGIARGSELEDRVAEMLRRVGLLPSQMHRYPHAFSGGERQRVNIARALILEPRVVVADEAVSALDVSVRAQILNLLQDLRDELDLTYIFISHDLSVVESLCDRVAVMYLGKIVEVAETEALYEAPRHPYTEALISAVPRPDPRLRGTGRRVRLSDEFPDPTDPPTGCYFHTRCRYADDSTCREREPELVLVGDGHRSACHYSDSLRLEGARVGVVDPPTEPSREAPGVEP